ncbi:MAG: hypothetical protein KF856_09065 [Cyclobacteriaceae bacterium]|nr:hypothetical protein [Cyclobacteriaceae bacterium]
MFKLIDKLKTVTFFKLTTIYLRYLIGFAFVFASIVKIKGERFTTLPTDTAVGYFFEAMYQSGFYWRFLGWSQLIAGVLMMTQRFATIGAMMFFPIILNITLITHSVNFGTGTPTVTTLMLLGTLYLLLWDYRKWIILFKQDHRIKLDLTVIPEDRFMTHKAWVLAGVAFVVLTIAPNFFSLQQHSALPAIWAGCLLLTGISVFIYMMLNLKKLKS